MEVEEEAEAEEEEEDEEEVEPRQSDGRAERQRNLGALRLIYISLSAWKKKIQKSHGRCGDGRKRKKRRRSLPVGLRVALSSAVLRFRGDPSRRGEETVWTHGSTRQANGSRGGVYVCKVGVEGRGGGSGG